MKNFLIRLVNCQIIGADKILHFCFCYIISHILDLVTRNVINNINYSFFLIIVFSFLLSLLKEFFDKYIKHSNFCWYDILSGMIGCFFYILTKFL